MIGETYLHPTAARTTRAGLLKGRPS
jgi:hypothetical protein